MKNQENTNDNRWIKIGYDEEGCLIQYNPKTKKIRKLTQWVEIFRIDKTVSDHLTQRRKDEDQE